MTLDAYVLILGKLDVLPVLAADDRQAAVMRMERELRVEELMRVLPAED